MMWNILWTQSVLKLGKPCFMLLSLVVYVVFCKITTQTLKKRKYSPLNTGSNNPENSIIIYHSIKIYHQNNKAIRGCLTSTTHQHMKIVQTQRSIIFCKHLHAFVCSIWLQIMVQSCKYYVYLCPIHRNVINLLKPTGYLMHHEV